MSESWWSAASEIARNSLEEFFEGERSIASYSDSANVARDVLVLAVPLLVVAPGARTEEEQEAVEANLVRLMAVTHRLCDGDPVEIHEVRAARWVLGCFEPVGPRAGYILLATRLGFAAMQLIGESIAFPEMWGAPAPDAFCLAYNAYDALSDVGQTGEDPPESDFWIQPDDTIPSLLRAREISEMVKGAGGGNVMSNN